MFHLLFHHLSALLFTLNWLFRWVSSALLFAFLTLWIRSHSPTNFKAFVKNDPHLSSECLFLDRPNYTWTLINLLMAFNHPSTNYHLGNSQMSILYTIKDPSKSKILFQTLHASLKHEPSSNKSISCLKNLVLQSPSYYPYYAHLTKLYPFHLFLSN